MLLITVKAILLAFFSLLQYTAAQDPCLSTTYHLLDDSWRSSENDGSDASFFQCDASLTERWYRPVSGAGVTMPTAAPDLNKCGTQYPIWMNDVLPDTSNITSVTVCMRHVFAACQQTWSIRVKKCSSFYVYELKQTNLCAAAYCFGSELPCPVGQSSDTGFTPGCGVAPNVTLNAVVIPGLNATSGEAFGQPVIIKEIQFQCNIEDSSDEDLTAYVYDVQWYINDNSIVTHRNIPYANITESALRQSQWINTFTLGFLVKCAVRVRDVPDGPPTPYSYSSAFYAGFTTDASQYTVLESGSINVTVRLTIPIDCMYPATSTPAEIADFEENHCSLTIRVRTPTYYEDGHLKCTASGVTDDPVTFQNEGCGIVFPFHDWNIPRTLQVFGAADNTVNTMDSRSSYIRFRADNGILNPAWGFATKPDIQIVVEDQDKLIAGKTCTTRTDPHIWTFDGRYMSFQQFGEFILFKHDTLPIQVHAVFDRCPGIWGSCICGIAIRNQDAVFIINLCRNMVGSPWISGSSNTNRYIEMRACDDTHMTVTSSGSTYSVTLPSGTSMKIAIRGVSFISYIIIKPSLMDWKSSSGLCGFLDGIWTNDFRQRDGTITNNFGFDWRLNPALDGNSLFAVSEPLTDIPLPPLQYCRCSVDSDNPQAFSSQVLCNITSTITACTRRTSSAGYVQECDKARARRDTRAYSYRYRRSTEEEGFDIAKFDVILDEQYANIVQNYTWQNGWTESLAEQSCRETMNDDPMLNKCKGVLPGMNDALEEGMNDCINDIKISGGSEFLKATVESLKSSCLVEASRFENLTTQGSENSNGTTFLDELLELSCPNDCSENGNCTNGKCVCYTGFYGEECALERDTIPEILHGGMTCSTDKKSCKNFVISGSNFLDVNLTCQARLIKVYVDRWEFLGAPILFPARYLNGINCVCIIPDSVRRRRAADDVFGEGYLISISNDGINFSNESTIVTYDSTCYDCDATNISCTQLESCVSTTTLASTEAASSTEQSPVTEMDIQTSSPDNAVTKTTSLPTDHLTTLTATASGYESRTVTIQSSSTSTDSFTGTVQPSSITNYSVTETIQPSPTRTDIGTLTIQPSPVGVPSGTATIQPTLTTTTSESLQNKSRDKEDDLPLAAMVGGTAAGIVFILAITTSLLCWKSSKSKKSKIGLSNADMTECPTRERYKAESDVLTSRPSSASGIAFQFDDDKLYKQNWG
ncbi:von Willebrand factor D and EGF domain-containing protein-like [Mizuhopecten yessoensis]|uniref:von Willebrand factor D and EGF domain-containing protein-like n=1 Tax=Mizuhopecten yessoensis TaxID=6573 RepID=UPI000B45A189|nr:von Willebrand factor D and EGF domain-containing protein-like [Mizuhopecten yessoensis]